MFHSLRLLFIPLSIVFISACDSARQDVSCTNDGIQESTQQLMIMSLQEMLKVKTPSERLLSSSAPSNPHLNSLKSQNISTVGVTFSDVVTIEEPEKTDDGEYVEAEELSYVCSATLNMPLDDGMLKPMRNLFSHLVNEQGVFQPEVVYTSALNVQDEVYISFKFEDPLLQMSLMMNQ